MTITEHIMFHGMNFVSISITFLQYTRIYTTVCIWGHLMGKDLHYKTNLPQISRPTRVFKDY